MSPARPAAAWRAFYTVLLAAGAALRLWEYVASPSQNVDELAVSRSIVGLSWRSLAAGRLEFQQVAPPGFALLAKLAATIGGGGDLSLRFVAVLSSLLALALFFLLARRLLAGEAAVAVALALFAVRPELIDFAAQVKPYAGDVAAALGLTLLSFDAIAAGLTPRRGLLLGAAGAGVVWFSNASVLVLGALAPVLVIAAWAGRHARRVTILEIGAVLGPWAAAAAAAVTVQRAAMTPLGNAYLQDFWASSFAPWDKGLGGNGQWLLAKLAAQLPAAGLGQPWRGLYCGLGVLGAVALWRRHGVAVLCLAAPVVGLAAAAEAHLYPFYDRLVLFLAAPVVLVAAAGVDGVADLWRLAGGPRRVGAAPVALAIAAVLALAAPPVRALASNPPVYRREEMEPVLRDFAARRQPGDAVYVYYGAGQAALFYGPDYGLRRQDFLLGTCSRGDTRAYLRELDRFRGLPRVWVLFSHALRPLGERADIVAYLDAIGTRRLRLVAHPHPPAAGFDAEALLYDLGPAPRPTAVGAPTPVTPVSAVSAATFPLPRRVVFDPRFACAGPHNPASSLP